VGKLRAPLLKVVTDPVGRTIVQSFSKPHDERGLMKLVHRVQTDLRLHVDSPDTEVSQRLSEMGPSRS
jgi:hypothetical protein